MKKYGIQTVKNGDFYEIEVKNGTMSVGNTLFQNQAFILRGDKGDFVENPEIGVGLTTLINDHNPQELKREIILQLKKEGMKISKLNLNASGIDLEADYS